MLMIKRMFLKSAGKGNVICKGGGFMIVMRLKVIGCWIPFAERIWYRSNASLSLDWRKNSSIGYTNFRIKHKVAVMDDEVLIRKNW